MRLGDGFAGNLALVDIEPGPQVELAYYADGQRRDLMQELEMAQARTQSANVLNAPRGPEPL